MPKSSTLNLDSTTLLIIIIIVLVIIVVVFFFNKEKENFTENVPDCTSEQKVGAPCSEEGYSCRSKEPVEGGRSNIIWCYDKEFRGDA